MNRLGAVFDFESGVGPESLVAVGDCARSVDLGGVVCMAVVAGGWGVCAVGSEIIRLERNAFIFDADCVTGVCVGSTAELTVWTLPGEFDVVLIDELDVSEVRRMCLFPMHDRVAPLRGSNSCVCDLHVGVDGPKPKGVAVSHRGDRRIRWPTVRCRVEYVLTRTYGCCICRRLRRRSTCRCGASSCRWRWVARLVVATHDGHVGIAGTFPGVG